MLLDELLRVALPQLAARQVVELRVGLTYTAARLDDGAVGVAATQADWPVGGCRVNSHVGELVGRAAELAGLVLEKNPVDVAAGLATINAAVNTHRGGTDRPVVPECTTDLLDLLAIGGDETVAMVGHFGPLVRQLTGRCKLLVFERKMQGEGLLSEQDAERLLPGADVAIITASALVNGTMEHLLELARAVPRVAIAGPTTPLVPELFKPRNVRFLAGMRFSDAPAVLRVVSHAGGVPALTPLGRKVTLLL
jgi:uncharacterized protein (DUF4213/DUF364 family)